MAVLFGGVGVALVTLLDEAGEVDPAATADLAAELADRGMRAVLACGTTGEAGTLTPDERSAVIRAVRLAVPDRVPVLAGTGAVTAAEAAELTRAACAVGADAVLAWPPPGSGAGQAASGSGAGQAASGSGAGQAASGSSAGQAASGSSAGQAASGSSAGQAASGSTNLAEYYEAVAAAAGHQVPVLAYHVPWISAPGVPVTGLGSLPVAGIKDSSGSADRLLDEVAHYRGPVYVGSSALLALAGPMGVAGAILALANVEPERCLRAFAGDGTAQRELAGRHLEVRAGGPAALKRLLAADRGTVALSRVG